MKKIILLLYLTISFIFSNAQDLFPNSSKKGNDKIKIESKKEITKVGDAIKSSQEEKFANATIDFESKVIDYGVIDHNGDGNREFIFTNNGTEPLIIKNAKGSCGCTVPTFPREEIMPGTTEKIKVKYATNRVGKFTKTITLTTNISKKPIILTVKGEVNPPPKEINVPEKNNTGAPLEKK